MNFVVIGIEHQEHPHYLMPLRCMGYETREYERQASQQGWQMLQDHQERPIPLTNAEYLCRFRKEDRLHRKWILFLANTRYETHALLSIHYLL